MKVWYVFPFIPFISGWFCVYIPLGLFKSGNSCVGESVTVGQRIMNPNTGKVGVVKELHGRSDRCQSAVHPIVATLDYDWLASPDVTHHVAAILNAGWMVRHYVRGARGSTLRLEREQAIQHLGLIVREAFNSSEQYEALLVAVVDGLRPKDDPPF